MKGNTGEGFMPAFKEFNQNKKLRSPVDARTKTNDIIISK